MIGCTSVACFLGGASCVGRVLAAVSIPAEGDAHRTLLQKQMLKQSGGPARDLAVFTQT